MVPAFPDVTLVQLLQRIAAFAVVLAWYGPVATWLARRAGDPGPGYDGRSSVNPVVHLDLVGLAGAIFFRIGWMKALDVDPGRFRAPRRGLALVVLGSSAALIVLGLVALALRPLVLAVLDGDGALAVSGVLAVIFELSVATALLNLLPIPPLMGALWVGLARPALARRAYEPRFRIVGTVVLVIALWLGWLSTPIRAVVSSVRSAAGF